MQFFHVLSWSVYRRVFTISSPLPTECQPLRPVLLTKNNPVCFGMPPRGRYLLWLVTVGTWWSLQSTSCLRSVIFLCVLCIFTVWKNTLGGKNPLYFGRLLKFQWFSWLGSYYHCHLEGFFDLIKPRWCPLRAPPDPTHPSIIAAVILLSLPEAVLPLNLRLWAVWEHTLCLFILYLQQTT